MVLNCHSLNEAVLCRDCYRIAYLGTELLVSLRAGPPGASTGTTGTTGTGRGHKGPAAGFRVHSQCSGYDTATITE